jgi:REP element-mobilizing transposase RayT
VTICTQNRECFFGQMNQGQMVPNGAGQLVESVWRQFPQAYPGVEVDAFVVMPNHVHGIIVLVGAGPRVCPDTWRPHGAHLGQPQGVAPTNTLSLPDVVHRFKSLITAKYRWGVRTDGWQPFTGRLWQRNYYEHIIRDEEELDRVRQYITDNPAGWQDDEENPEVWGSAL